jgi:hypothetical protein
MHCRTSDKCPPEGRIVMKSKAKRPKPAPVTETFGGAYHRFESTYRLPERLRQHGKPAKKPKGSSRAS